jgi:hypothetical protein
MKLKECGKIRYSTEIISVLRLPSGVYSKKQFYPRVI